MANLQTAKSLTLSKLSGVPNDMIQAIGGIACVVLAPVVQAGYAIFARHRIIPSSSLLITLAFILCGVTLGYSSGIQHLIYVSPPCYNLPLTCLGGGVPNRVSVWLQVPMYFIAVRQMSPNLYIVADQSFCRPSQRSSDSSQFLKSLLSGPQKRQRPWCKLCLKSLLL